jgi:hypothetical protein
MLSRIQNSTLPGRPRLGLKQAMISVGKPINVNEKWENYQGNKQALRTGVSELTQDLHKMLEELIRD